MCCIQDLPHISTPPRKHRTTVIESDNDSDSGLDPPPTHAGHMSSEEEDVITSKEQESSAAESKKSDTDNSVAPKRPKYEKTADDAIPLPDPFPLPKHYRTDVELALASGKMTKDTTAAFMSAIAAAMLVYKRYPTREDKICVARSIIAKYKFMASPIGTPYVSDHYCYGNDEGSLDRQLALETYLTLVFD